MLQKPLIFVRVDARDCIAFINEPHRSSAILVAAAPRSPVDPDDQGPVPLRCRPRVICVWQIEVQFLAFMPAGHVLDVPDERELDGLIRLAPGPPSCPPVVTTDATAIIAATTEYRSHIVCAD